LGFRYKPPKSNHDSPAKKSKQSTNQRIAGNKPVKNKKNKDKERSPNFSKIGLLPAIRL
jgi:hypothetical protein